MSETAARYEFRAFSQSFGIVEETIRRLGQCSKIHETREIYLLRPGALDENVKVRNGRLEVKRLVTRDQGLEQWQPSAELVFPISALDLAQKVFPGLQRPFDEHSYDRDTLLHELVGGSKDLFRVNVFKRRFRFSVEGCEAEIDEVLVNGCGIKSVALEAADSQLVATVRKRVHLHRYENVSYPLLLARTLGLEPLPGQEAYGE